MDKKEDRLNKLLGTENREEQADRVESLFRSLNMPIIDLIFRFDPVLDDVQLSIIGGDIDFDLANHIMDLARKHLHQAEVKASIAKSQRESPGSSGPAAENPGPAAETPE